MPAACTGFSSQRSRARQIVASVARKMTFVGDAVTCVEINQCVGCSAMTRPSWLGRAVRNRHRHAIEQASRRWRGGRHDYSNAQRILISTQVNTVGAPKAAASTIDMPKAS